MFDRDEPTREKEVYLTVRATDNGRPQLDDACTVKVVIEDINDNSPVFDKVVSVIHFGGVLLVYYSAEALNGKYVLTYMEHQISC
jgi:hypothetical protein